MKHMKFGSETKMTILADNCPGCGTPRGQLHGYGCVLESCPQCGGRLLKCKCCALSMADSLKLTKAIADGLTDRTQFTQAILETYVHDALVQRVMLDLADAQIKQRIKEEGIQQEDGYYVLTDENVSKLLGISEEEAREILEELQGEAVYPGWQDQETIGEA